MVGQREIGLVWTCRNHEKKEGNDLNLERRRRGFPDIGDTQEAKPVRAVPGQHLKENMRRGDGKMGGKGVN